MGSGNVPSLGYLCLTRKHVIFYSLLLIHIYVLEMLQGRPIRSAVERRYLPADRRHRESIYSTPAAMLSVDFLVLDENIMPSTMPMDLCHFLSGGGQILAQSSKNNVTTAECDFPQPSGTSISSGEPLTDIV